MDKIFFSFYKIWFPTISYWKVNSFGSDICDLTCKFSEAIVPYIEKKSENVFSIILLKLLKTV